MQKRLIALAFAPLLLAPLLGLGYARIQISDLEHAAFRDLESVAQLKTDWIETWLAERLGDSRALQNSRGLGAEVAEFVARPTERIRRALLSDRLEAVRASYDYQGAMLVDRDARPLLRAGDDEDVPPELAAAVSGAVASGAIVHTDLYREGGEIHMDWVSPILAPAPSERRVLAAIVLRTRPATFLLPLVGSWPTTRATAGGLLLRRDGSEVLYITGTPEYPAPLTHRAPISADRYAPALQADTTGAMRIRNDRGVDALAAFREIRGTRWRLVTRIDRAEVTSPMWRAVRWITLIALVGLVAIAFALWRLLRQQRRLSALEAEAVHARAGQQLRSLGDNLPNGFVYRFEIAPDGVSRFSHISAGVERTNGVSAAAVLAAPDQLFQQIDRDDYRTYQQHHAASARDLTAFGAMLTFNLPGPRTVWLQFQEQPHRLADGTTAWDGVAVDVSERVLRERRAERLKGIYADLAKVSEVILRAKTEDELLALICRIPIESGMMAMAWIGVEDPATNCIVARYRTGKNTEYLDDIVISTRGDVPEGLGGSGVAWRTGKPVVNDDIANNPAMEPWHQRARQYGWNSSASLPIFRQERIYAILGVYTELPGAFDAEVMSLLSTMAADVSFGLDSLDARRKLLDSQSRIQGLIGAIPDLIFVHSADGRYTDAYIPADQQPYVPVEMFLGRRIDDVLPGPIAADFLTAFERASRERELQVLDYSLPINGTVRQYEARVMPSNADTLIAIVRDRTAAAAAERELDTYRHHLEDLVRQRTDALTAALQQLQVSEDALRRSSQEQTTIFETASMGIVYARDRVIVRCNRRFADLLGYGTSELVGVQEETLYADNAAYQRVGLAMERARADGVNFDVEFEARRKGGTRFLARLIGRYLDQGSPDAGAVAIVEDITKARHADDAMRAAKELAEESTRAKSDFLANMSHEIRTPMNVIIGMSYLMRSTQLNARQQDFMQKIQLSGEHLLAIINDILDFAKIDAGKLPMERVEFELHEVIDKAVALVHERATAKGLELLLDIEQGAPDFLVGDPLRLAQILINYTNNAVKFTERGEVVVQMRVREADENSVLLYFAVRDTGIGLAPDRAEEVFESFQQADTSTTRQHGGTGLGLAISKSLAAMMGGEVGVQSALGAGATFWFTARLERSTHRKPDRLPRPELRGRRVLVVDDNATARDVLSAQLRHMRFLATAVDSGRAAIDEVRRAAAAGMPFEIVFLDWQMPGMDGLETARELCGDRVGVQPHIVMVTAFDRETLLRQARNVGVDVHEALVKPVSASTLFDTAIRVVSDSSDETPNPPAHTSSEAFQALRGRHVLLVEDNDLNREVATELLRAVGVEVDTASDGQVAIERLGVRDYDVVLMDMQMPVMDGLTATREIRLNPRYATLPILAMTANAMRGDRDQCLAAGMNEHIAKPIDPDELWTKLLAAIGHDVAPVAGGRPAGLAPRALTIDVGLLGGPLEGLDVEQGLRRVGGTPSVYLSVLRTFLNGHRAVTAQIVEALACGDRERAQRLAHSLKGVAATLGAEPLKADAGSVETLLRADAPTVEFEPALGRLAATLGSLVAQLDRRLPRDPALPTEPAPPIDWREFEAVRSVLAPLLSHGRYEAGALVDRHRLLLQSALGDAFGRFSAAVQAFDYPLAGQQLRDAVVVPPPSA